MFSCLSQLSCKNKRVFVRADCNIPLNGAHGNIHDFRLQSLIPTLNHIINSGGKVILATHLGRPPAQSRTDYFDEKLSTSQLIPWFERHGYAVEYEIDLMQAIERSHQNNNKILLIENLRFFNGEQEPDYEFAQLLAQLGDIYVNDAFGMIHRHDTSVTLLAEQFPSRRRCAGLLMEKECKELELVRAKPAHPFVMIIGGSKIKDKLGALLNLVSLPLGRKPDQILVGGIPSLVLLRARNTGVTYPAIPTDCDTLALQIIGQAEKNGVELVLPSDFITLDEQTNAISITSGESVHPIIDIGPATIEQFQSIIAKAKTVICNGTMGKYEIPEGAEGSRQILHALTNNKGLTIIGGGDTVAATRLFGYESSISFLSTGGGALLAYLASSNPFEELPALKVLSKT